jgi:hypothetical protein
MNKIKQNINVIIFGIIFLTFCLKRDFKEWLKRPKIYLVESSGHGSKFFREPNPKLMTFDEAKADAIYWHGIADTIGGEARVINTLTGKVVFQI